MTIGQAIEKLRLEHGMLNRDMEKVMKVSGGGLNKIKKDQRELSFLQALRLLEHFELCLDEFCSMLSEEELNRPDLVTTVYYEKEELRRAARKNLRPIGPDDVAYLEGKDLLALVMGHIQEQYKKENFEQKWKHC